MLYRPDTIISLCILNSSWKYELWSFFWVYKPLIKIIIWLLVVSTIICILCSFTLVSHFFGESIVSISLLHSFKPLLLLLWRALAHFSRNLEESSFYSLLFLFYCQVSFIDLFLILGWKDRIEISCSLHLGEGSLFQGESSSYDGSAIGVSAAIFSMINIFRWENSAVLFLGVIKYPIVIVRI